jgi:hypothetical protein
MSMSWLARFEDQWLLFLEIVESRVRREVERENSLETGTVNALIQEEVRRSWSSGTHLNGVWLRNLKQDYPELGEALQEGLSALRVKQTYHFEEQLSGGPLLAGLGSGGMLYVAMRKWPVPLHMRLIVSVLAGLLGLRIARLMRNRRRQKELDELVEHLRLELEEAVQSLQLVAEQADDPQYHENKKNGQ